jgi:hypothetical protein
LQGSALALVDTDPVPLPSRAAAVVSLLSLVAVGGCGATDASSDVGATSTRLAETAVKVGAAIDGYTRWPFRFPPARFTSEVLDDAGVILPEGVSVTNYERGTTADTGATRDLANPDDYWKFCLSDADGNWLTYGEKTGMQAFGSGSNGDAACVFSGGRSPDAPFDIRLFAVDAYRHITQYAGVESDGYEYPRALDAEALKLFGLSLPTGWAVSAYDQRGWTSLQYCVTAPGDEWFYVRERAVDRLGDEGSCELHPDMPGH